MKKNEKIILWIVIIVVILIFLIIKNSAEPEEYDNFAKCLTEKGAKIYGAYWCPHCNDQKALFSKSWKHVNYIECSLPNRRGQTQICIQAGINGYPTWEFQDGTREEGKLSFEELGQHTGCVLE